MSPFAERKTRCPTSSAAETREIDLRDETKEIPLIPDQVEQSSTGGNVVTPAGAMV
jgi:hypothetical protein